jgi:hypothetical protein
MRRSRIRCTPWFDLSFCLTQRRKDAKVLLRKAIDVTFFANPNSHSSSVLA